MTMTHCIYKNCPNPVFVRKHGLCCGHYNQMKRGKPLSPVGVEQVAPCLVEHCIRVQRSRGLCNVHASIGSRYKIETVDLVAFIRARFCYGCQDTIPECAKLVFDHDHGCCLSNNTCGKCLRGTLCNSCNVALGRSRDKPTNPALVRYLENSPHLNRTQPWVPIYKKG